MPTKGVTGYWYKTGTVVKQALMVGPWTELIATIGGVDYQLGTVKKGNILFEARLHKHRATADLLDALVPSAVAVEFRGIMEEIHRENMLLLLDRDPTEAKVPANGDEPEGRIQIPKISYPAQYFTLYGRRPNAMGDDREAFVFCLFKCRMADLVQLASGDDGQGIRFKVKALNDSLGVYGGSADQPYGWFFAGIESAGPQPHPGVDVDADWWEFDNTPPNDYLETQSDYGDDFDPAGDFTVMMMVEEMTQATNRVHGLMGKSTFGLGYPGGWDVVYHGSTSPSYPGGIWFTIGKDGVRYRDLRLHSPGPMLTGRMVLVACSYKWIGDGTSIMRIVTHDAVNGKLSAQLTNAYGPVANNSLKMQIAATHRYVRPTGKHYWTGFYDGVVISDADILEVWNKTKHPITDFNPTVFNWYGKAVGPTYEADVGNGPNAPYTFDVFGTPVKGP